MGTTISKKNAVILASVSFVGIGLLVKKKQKQQSLDQLLSKQDLEQFLDTNERFNEYRLDTQNEIDIQYNKDGSLEEHTIVEIYGKQLELAADDYIKLTKQNRLQRRRLRKTNIQIYIDAIIRYILDIEEILDQTLKRILYDLDIPKEIFEESVLIRMDQGHFQELYMLQASVKQRLKEKIPFSKKLNSKQIKEIIAHHIQILKYFPQEFHQILKNIPSENIMLVPTIINLIVQDIIYSKFSIEEEEQIQCLKQINDPDIHTLLMQVEQEMSNLLKIQGIRLNEIPESLENFI